MSTPAFDQQELITILFRDDADEGDLQPYLERRLGIRLLVECAESADWQYVTLFLLKTTLPIGL
jgi:hypothetical protein